MKEDIEQVINEELEKIMEKEQQEETGPSSEREQ